MTEHHLPTSVDQLVDHLVAACEDALPLPDVALDTGPCTSRGFAYDTAMAREIGTDRRIVTGAAALAWATEVQA